MSPIAEGSSRSLADQLLKQSQQDAAATPMDAVLDAARRQIHRQKPIEEVFDFLLRPWAPEPSRALGGSQ